MAMIITNPRLWRFGGAAAILALSGCVSTVASQNTGAQSAHASAAAGANAIENFNQNGYHLQDVETMAGIMAGDIPQSPRIQALGNAQVRIVIDARNIRLQNDGAFLNRQAFAHDLRVALERLSPQSVRYVDGREAGAGSGRLQAGAKRSGGGRSSQSSGAIFVMDIDVSALPAQPGQVGAQRYVLRVASPGNQQGVWQGSYDLDAPRPAQ